MEPFAEPSNRRQPRLRLNTSSSSESSGNIVERLSHGDVDNGVETRANADPASRPDRGTSTTPESRWLIRPSYFHHARDLTEIFPKLFANPSWPKASYVCGGCKMLVRGIYAPYLHSSTSEIDSVNTVDPIVLDPIQGEALRGCGNCQFLLGCLRRATFRRERPDTPIPIDIFSHQYQLWIGFKGAKECQLKLESIYEKCKKGGARGRKYYQPGIIYTLASCSLVLCGSDGTNNIDKDPRSAKSVSLVSQWLRECRNHENCRPQTEVVLPTRVINIPATPGENPSLWATHGELVKYIALSHCWGSSESLKTTIDTIEAHENEIPLEDLPPSFRDAVDIAQRLDFKHLWIDSLCIIQDSVQDWANECSKMSTVYANATLVIGAAAAINSTQGFLNHRNIHEGPLLGAESGCFLREKTTPRKDQRNKPLFSRAWAYQEVLLAPRLLLYGSRQMSWECRHGIRYEGENIAVSSNASCSKKQFYQVIDSPPPKSNIQIDPDGKQPTIGDYSPPILQNICNRLNKWYGCVEDYSLRQLTYASDKLPALSGLASKIQDPTMGEYLAGIWSKDLDTGLFWARHIAREELYSRPFFKCPDFRAPSWSWASCEGPVNFRVRDIYSRPAIATDVAFTSDKFGQSQRNFAKLVDHRMLLATSDKYGQS